MTSREYWYHKDRKFFKNINRMFLNTDFTSKTNCIPLPILSSIRDLLISELIK